ncbi:MAG TPA: RNB domain-containing ribonuclease, partial [Terriglobales bacterium]
QHAREMEIPQDVHITPRMYQKLTEKIAGKPEERILSYLMLRSLKQARYSEENAGHFALAATTYTHFTSPIRRYPDLIVHRILKDVLRESAELWDSAVPIGTLMPGAKAPSPSHSGAALKRRSSTGIDEDLGGKGRETPGPIEVPRAQAERNLDHAAMRALEGRANLAQRGSAGKATGKDQVPEGRPNRQEEGSRPGRPRHTDQHHTNEHHTDPASPWSKRREREPIQLQEGPIALEDLHAIAEESSQSERRADEAERELMEWKKAKFMQDRIGEDFDGLIISVTKFGFFVELADLFVEGLVPLDTLTDDRYTFHENTREIIGQHSRRAFHLGDKVRVLVDRIDPVEKKIQFALLEEKPTGGTHGRRKRHQH